MPVKSSAGGGWYGTCTWSEPTASSVPPATPAQSASTSPRAPDDATVAAVNHRQQDESACIGERLEERAVGGLHPELAVGREELDAARPELLQLDGVVADQAPGLPDRRVRKDVDRREREELVAGAKPRLGRRLSRLRRRERERGRRAAAGGELGGGREV